jgi:hypothetical protein
MIDGFCGCAVNRNLCANVASSAGGDEMPVFKDIVQLPDYGDHGIK